MAAPVFSVATWNVNSLRRRLQALGWFAVECAPDVICLQETKVTDDLFPTAEIAALGYPHQAFAGMKAYNGVAILSKVPLDHVATHSWCEREDCRHIEAVADAGPGFGAIEIHSVYVPAGGDVADPVKNLKFRHKLEFLTELTHWWAARGAGERRILTGDLNIAPLTTDVWSHERLRRTVTHTEIEISHLEHLRRSAGWVDAVRRMHPADEPVFTWWSYRAEDWEAANKGRRLDHVWVSADLAGRLQTAEVFKEARDWDPPSDHAPVQIKLAAKDAG